MAFSHEDMGKISKKGERTYLISFLYSSSVVQVQDLDLVVSSMQSNEKARLNVMYRGALLWNGLPAEKRNMEYKDFKNCLKNELLVG